LVSSFGKMAYISIIYIKQSISDIYINSIYKNLP